MDLVTGFNFAEALVWITVAAVMGWRSQKEVNEIRRLGVKTAAVFFAFGLTDFVEMKTGAWWDPPLLFAVKALCVLGIGVAGWKYRQLMARVVSVSDMRDRQR